MTGDEHDNNDVRFTFTASPHRSQSLHLTANTGKHKALALQLAVSDGVVRPLLYEGGVVHGLPRHHVLALLAAYQPRGVPHRGAPRRHVDEHHRPGADLRAGADPHVAEDGRAGADEHAVADLGVPVAHRLAGPAQRDVVEDGDVVAHDGGLADDDARGVVEEDALADGGGRVDVDGEDLSDA
uniref:Sat1 n=1 Tax=Arundo donax TaxID=35708 RepID=A0A0A9GDH9_ARUDO